MSKVAVVTPVAGVMLAAASNTGTVLVTVSLAEEVADEPSLSMMVAVHVMLSVGLEFPAVSVNVSVLPITFPLASCHS